MRKRVVLLALANDQFVIQAETKKIVLEAHFRSKFSLAHFGVVS